MKKLKILFNVIFLLNGGTIYADTGDTLPQKVEKWWSSIPAVGQLIIYIIVFLFLVSVLMIIRHILRFAWRERRSLNKVRENFSRYRSLEYGYADAQLCAALLPGSNHRSIIARQVEKLKTIIRSNKSFRYADVADLAYMKENSRFSMNFIKFSRANLVVLGLLGTFWGLILLVGDIDSVFATIDARNVQALLDSFKKATTEMANIIGPMQTAFSTSFVGLLGTLVLSFFTAFLDWARKKFFTRMESFMITDLIPLITVKDEAGTADDLKVAAEKLDNVTVRLSGVSDTIAADMENIHQIADIFGTSTDGIIKSQENLLKLIEDMDGMIREVRENSNVSRAEGSRLVEALDAHLKNMDDVNKRFVELQMNVDTWLDGILSPLQHQQQDFNRILQGTADENKRMLSQLSRDIAQRNTAIHDTFKQLLETQQNFVKEATGRYGDNIQTAAANVLEGFAKYESTMMEIAEKLKTVAGNLKNWSQNGNSVPASASHDEQSQRNLNIIKNTLADMFALSEKSQRSLNTIVKEVSGLKNNHGNGNGIVTVIGGTTVEGTHPKRSKKNIDFGTVPKTNSEKEEVPIDHIENRRLHQKVDTTHFVRIPI